MNKNSKFFHAYSMVRVSAYIITTYLKSLWDLHDSRIHLVYLAEESVGFEVEQ
ncbi:MULTISPECIES: hypothetical protein [unclassified Algoriphagus]|uniref:hypothetical protein n=1 Tax=unclassified Algoriphagus TaxID=2641541 RepID=UPI001C62B197|nr:MULTISPECIES: hypothetical protein [unclassified Algoriphagus]QYH38145.1 hypothetical protein GYM62_04795 [Algoriphagus sp. NBT04N3]